jgi:hypothetical protein
MNDTVLQRDRYFRIHNESYKFLLKFDKFTKQRNEKTKLLLGALNST